MVILQSNELCWSPTHGSHLCCCLPQSKQPTPYYVPFMIWNAMVGTTLFGRNQVFGMFNAGKDGGGYRLRWHAQGLALTLFSVQSHLPYVPAVYWNTQQRHRQRHTVWSLKRSMGVAAYPTLQQKTVENKDAGKKTAE